MIQYTDITLGAANKELIEHFRVKNDCYGQISEKVLQDFARQSIAEYLNLKLPEIITTIFTANPAYRIGQAMKE